MTDSKKRTSPWVIVLVCFGVVGLLIVGAIGAGVWWFSQKKESLIENGKASDAEARAFSETHNQSECIDEGLRKADQCQGSQGGLVCLTSANLFSERCVIYSSPPSREDDICTVAPPKNAIMKTVDFAQSQCNKRNRRDQACSQVMQSVARGCWRRPTP